MTDSERKKLIELNNTFYKNVADHFSKTRQYAWPGWGRVTEQIASFGKKNVSVLDLGCGNGRFYDFLIDEFRNNDVNVEIEYFGIDNNNSLLNEAKNKYPNAQFVNKDIFNLTNLSEQKFDVITAFGVTHHIPGKDFRLKWFKTLAKTLNTQGLLIFSHWEYYKDPRFSPVEGHELLSLLEEGDFLVLWDKNNDFVRYYHKYNESELKQVSNALNSKGLVLVESYVADGKSQDLNKYFIYKKLS